MAPSIMINYIAVDACDGADVWSSVQEAAIMCLQKEQEVHLTHRNKTFIINPKSLVAIIIGTQKKIDSK